MKANSATAFLACATFFLMATLGAYVGTHVVAELPAWEYLAIASVAALMVAFVSAITYRIALGAATSVSIPWVVFQAAACTWTYLVAGNRLGPFWPLLLVGALSAAFGAFDRLRQVRNARH